MPNLVSCLLSGSVQSLEGQAVFLEEVFPQVLGVGVTLGTHATHLQHNTSHQYTLTCLDTYVQALGTHTINLQHTLTSLAMYLSII